MFIISVLVPTERKYVRKHQSISIFKIVTLTARSPSKPPFQSIANLWQVF